MIVGVIMFYFIVSHINNLITDNIIKNKIKNKQLKIVYQAKNKYQLSEKKIKILI